MTRWTTSFVLVAVLTSTVASGQYDSALEILFRFFSSGNKQLNKEEVCKNYVAANSTTYFYLCSREYSAETYIEETGWFDLHMSGEFPPFKLVFITKTDTMQLSINVDQFIPPYISTVIFDSLVFKKGTYEISLENNLIKIQGHIATLSLTPVQKQIASQPQTVTPTQTASLKNKCDTISTTDIWRKRGDKDVQLTTLWMYYPDNCNKKYYLRTKVITTTRVGKPEKRKTKKVEISWYENGKKKSSKKIRTRNPWHKEKILSKKIVTWTFRDNGKIYLKRTVEKHYGRDPFW